MSAYRIIRHIESVAKGREYDLIVATNNRAITGRVKSLSEYYVELELSVSTGAVEPTSIFVSTDKIETVKPVWRS